MEFCSLYPSVIQFLTKALKLSLIADGEIDVRGVVVHWTTELVCVLDCRMPGLDSLLCRWDVTAGDRIEIRLVGNLQRTFHFGLSKVRVKCRTPAFLDCQ